jgi:hypothetical protein
MQRPEALSVSATPNRTGTIDDRMGTVGGVIGTVGVQKSTVGGVIGTVDESYQA